MSLGYMRQYIANCMLTHPDRLKDVKNGFIKVQDGYSHPKAASPPSRRDPQLPAIVTDGMESLESRGGGRAEPQTQDDRINGKVGSHREA